MEKMQEHQQEQHDKLSELIDKVNDQAHMVGRNAAKCNARWIHTQDSTVAGASTSAELNC